MATTKARKATRQAPRKAPLNAPRKAAKKTSKKAPAKRATPKSLYREESAAMLGTLRTLREAAGLTQMTLSQRMKRSQHFVSSIERGATRIDPVQLLDWCVACGASLSLWAKYAEKSLKERGFAV